MWHVYILRCKDSSLYTGSTTDVGRRLKEHNSGRGGSYTRVRMPARLMYQENYPNRSKAQKREAQIKSWTKNKKLALIQNKIQEA